jgi:hypothetical protein
MRLEIAEVGDEIESDPEQQETAEAIAERNQDLPQQVAVQQAHPAQGSGQSRRAARIKAPSSKLQAPEKPQIPKFEIRKSNATRFERSACA